MTQLASKLFAEAMQLSDRERGELAVKLIESLDPGTDGGAEAAWGEEIQRRLEELRTGKVQAVPWPEARRMILEDADDADAP
jgi:putative addiction module component (TIGR02574 family)